MRASKQERVGRDERFVFLRSPGEEVSSGNEETTRRELGAYIKREAEEGGGREVGGDDGEERRAFVQVKKEQREVR